jgi:uncharacterized Zn finger protein
MTPKTHAVSNRVLMRLQGINTSMPQSTLNNLSVREIRQLAGERFFARGQKYFDEGRVHGLTEYHGQVVAKVAGAEDYRIKLWAERGRLGYTCSCPVGDGGEF